MLQRFRSSLPTLVTALLAGTAVAVGPTMAEAAYDAVNAEKVDGKSAVGSKAAPGQRAGKLVATNSRGRLPNDIIAKAPDSDLLDGLDSNAFLQHDGVGTVTGQGDNDDPTTGDDGVVSGQLQLATVGRSNLVDDAVDATKLADGSVSVSKLSASLLAELVTVAQLAALKGTSANQQPNDGDGFVHWNNLEGLPGHVLDGRVTGADVDDGTLIAADLAGAYDHAGDQVIVGAVTGEKIADGAVEARDLSPQLYQRLVSIEQQIVLLDERLDALEASR